MRLLLKAGSDVDAVSSAGLTALMSAALGGHTAVVSELLQAGANPNLKDAKGWSALTHARASATPTTVRVLLDKTAGVSADDRHVIVGGVYINEYYSSNDAKLLDLAVRKAVALLKKSAELDSRDPDRHYWIAAVSSMFASRSKVASAAELASIINDGIDHARKAIALDPEFADAMDHLSVVYQRKGDKAAADLVHADAVRIRERRSNRPSRFNDQFSRPAVSSRTEAVGAGL